MVRLIAALAAIASALQADWTQFRGPNGQGIASDQTLPVEFGPERNLIWKTEVPPGHSSPVLIRDRIFLTAFEPGKLSTICLNRADGKMLWRRDVAPARQNKLRKPNNPAAASPVTDGRNVWVFFQDFGLLSYTRDGRESWRLPLGPFRVYYGYGASPILADGKVIVAVDQDGGDSYLLAVDAATGKTRWRIARPDVISGYSTPVVHGKHLLIAESFQLSAYSIATGERMWKVPGLACEMKSVPSIAGRRLFINGWGFAENQPGRQILLKPWAEALAQQDADRDGRLLAAEMPHERLKNPGYFGTFDLDSDGALNEPEWEVARAMLGAENGLLAIDLESRSVTWKYQKPVPQVPSTLLYRDVLFMVNDSGILISFDPATGGVIKQGRLAGAIDKYFASPVGAAGKVWLVSQDGTLSVVRAQGEWEVEAVNKLGDEVFATPAIDGGRIYARTKSAIYCFGLRGAGRG
jgi:outer membrane protein assembly factor BamB